MLRCKKLEGLVARHTCRFWARSIVSDMKKAAAQNVAKVSAQQLPVHRIVSAFARSRRCLIIADYDGPLSIVSGSDEAAGGGADGDIPLGDGLRKADSAFATKAQKAQGQSKRTLRRVLERLCADPRNTVLLISDRERAAMEHMFKNLRIGLAAEHGCFLRLPLESWGGWRAMGGAAKAQAEQEEKWKAIVRPVMQFYIERTPGSRMKERETELVWQLGDADTDFGHWQACAAHTPCPACAHAAICMQQRSGAGGAAERDVPPTHALCCARRPSAYSSLSRGVSAAGHARAGERAADPPGRRDPADQAAAGDLVHQQRRRGAPPVGTCGCRCGLP